ncbi:MAG: UDP-4-amino-4,6-dideoxy-N-acetyl-beta-L-altrosamine transaminase [Alphaproteobacteria bacterium]|nr:UDP-4-amino-4,6-dideoxy-N-acetyl-beta-L-altrosamine transaminase [Alphaproteobacteria bacterium]
MIPYSRQDISQEDIDLVVDVLRSDFLTQGPVVPLFEEVVKKHVGANYAVAVNNATSALHIACLSLGIGPGDWLWTSPITFVASANCGLYCGAKIDFVDIDPRTYNISPRSLEKKLTEAEKKGKLPKVLVAVHLCGQSCEMESLYAICKEYGVKIIEDASHAIGGKYKGQFIGSCRYSDITIFSFHPVKIITTGEGGMALTNDAHLAEKMTLLRSHGITRDEHLMTHDADGPWYYQQINLGFNYRMTDMHAALGVSQMQRLDSNVSKRNELASRYDKKLKGLPISTPHLNPNLCSAYHLYIIRLNSSGIRKTHKQVFEFLRENDIGVNVHYIPVHTQPYYQKMGFTVGSFPEAERYYNSAISLPIFPGLSFEEQDKVVRLLREIISE